MAEKFKIKKNNINHVVAGAADILHILAMFNLIVCHVDRMHRTEHKPKKDKTRQGKDKMP